MHFIITYRVTSYSMTAYVLSTFEHVIDLTLPKREQKCSRLLFCIDIGILFIVVRLIFVDVDSESMFVF